MYNRYSQESFPGIKQEPGPGRYTGGRRDIAIFSDTSTQSCYPGNIYPGNCQKEDCRVLYLGT